MQPIDNIESLEFPMELFIKPTLFVIGMISMVALLTLI